MIIGIVGPIASGKSMLADFFVKKGFSKLALSSELREEAVARNITIERKNLQDLGNNLRSQFGGDYLARKIMSKITEGNYVIEGIRNPFEVDAFRELKGFVLVAVDSPLERRFQRIMIRGKDSDPSSVEEVREIDRKDMNEAGNHFGQHTLACMKMADFTINNYSTRQKLERKIEKLIAKIEGNKLLNKHDKK